MIKNLIFCLIVFFAVPGYPSDGEHHDEHIAMKFSVSYNPKNNPESPNVKAVLAFRQELERLTDGEVRARIFWNDALSSSYESAVTSLHNGTIQLTQIPSGAMTKFSNALLPLGTFFLIPYPEAELAYEIIDSEAGDIIRDRVIKDSGLRIVGCWDTGFRHIASIGSPILTLSDLKNKKIRVQPMPVHIDGFKRLGAEPVVIAWQSLYASLQQNLVNITENSLENFLDAKLYDELKYLTLSGHTFEFVNFVTDQKYYESLPEHVRIAWDKAALHATEVYRKEMKKRAETDIEILREFMEISVLSKAEIEKFKKLVKPSEKVAEKESGKEYYQLIICKINDIKKAYYEKKADNRSGGR